MLSWLPNETEAGGRPIALEVKGSSDRTFYLSSGEWDCAGRLRAIDSSPAAYAVLVVRRKPGSDAPMAMDLLVDPVHLHETEQLKLDTDTYRASYGAPPPTL
jgi:hypothetical protein